MGAWPQNRLKPCGTWAAYQRHLRNRETPCDDCAEACRKRSAENRASLATLQRNRRAALARAVYKGRPRSGAVGATRARLRGEL